MDTTNKHDNRALQRAANDPKQHTAHLPTLQQRSYSVDGNVRVETHVTSPEYSHIKELATTAPIANQAAPNTGSGPAADEVWDLTGFAGGHGYLVLDAAEDLDIELWARDQQNGRWLLVDTLQNVVRDAEFRFANQVRGRKIWLRLTNIGTSITDIKLRFSPE